MPKKLVLFSALVLGTSFLGGALVAAYQGTASIIGSDGTVLTATQEVLETVSRIRGLEIKSQVKAGLKSRDQIEQAVIRDLDENTTPQEFAATSKTLTKFGLIPRGFQLRECVIKVLREQVAGFYEPKSREFFLAGWLPMSEQKPVMAHELTHALQDQHFNLRRFEHWPKGDSDAELAAHALVEGDATVVMLQYSVDQEGRSLDVTKIGSLTALLLQQTTSDDSQKYPALSASPAVLRETLQFPYVYGVGFVQEVLKNGSRAGLDRTFSKLPLSSEQVIHPDRFIAGDAPVRIEVPALAGVLGSSWKEIDTDVNGEFGCQLALAEFIEAKKAREAAAGWGGDKYVLLENQAGGSLLLAQVTTWDTETDARQFFDAYCERTLKRYHLAAPVRTPSQRMLVSTNEGLVSVELRGKDVVSVEGAVSQQQLSRATALLWRSGKSN
jgi:hypothetical protein